MTIHPLACWAKLSRSKEQTGYHPLLYHLIDVAVVTETLWNEVLPAAARQRVADDLGVDCYPHAPGGEPAGVVRSYAPPRSSPRTWG